MRYLFFDIECCNGRDICEFGYVITDENFKPLEQCDITINPQNKFSLTGRPDHRDITLFYPNHVYYSSPKFDVFYKVIKNLIEAPDQIIVGHAIANDAKFLKTACDRYSLPPINFKFNDSQKMFKEYFNESRSISLENAGKRLEIEKPQYLHKSDDDSLLTMHFVQKMCEKLEVTLPELIELCPSCSGKMVNGNTSFDDSQKRIEKWIQMARDGGNNIIANKNIKLFRFFLASVKPQGEIKKTKLTGKSICISMNYEHRHFKEMLALIQIIVNCGGKYSLKSSQSDIFVEYSDNHPCSRLKFVEEANANGSDIKIISFSKLLELLNITEQELSVIPFPEASAFIRKRDRKLRYGQSRPKQQIERASVCLGDLLKSKKDGTPTSADAFTLLNQV